MLSNETAEITQLDKSTQNADVHEVLDDIQMEIEVITSAHDPPEDLPENINMPAEPAVNVLQEWPFLQADDVIETSDSIVKENESVQGNSFDHSYTITTTPAPAPVPAPV
ncbi:MAG: hypothetical protein N0C90_11070, partial [Candidatus Thiodiazotropha endolucinida]|nr:hypothetical protein [Candidatus Thiodiazotropha taylori]MCW4261901.1 hypothetical protein [Candidatus Thiodiazotropha endolucinida]